MRRITFKLLALSAMLLTVFTTACSGGGHPKFIQSISDDVFASDGDYAIFTDVSDVDTDTVQNISVQDYYAWIDEGKLEFETLMFVNENGQILYEIIWIDKEDGIETLKEICRQKGGGIVEPEFLKANEYTSYAYLSPASAKELDASDASVKPLLEVPSFLYSKEDRNWYMFEYIAEFYGEKEE